MQEKGCDCVFWWVRSAAWEDEWESCINPANMGKAGGSWHVRVLLISGDATLLLRNIYVVGYRNALHHCQYPKTLQWTWWSLQRHSVMLCSRIWITVKPTQSSKCLMTFMPTHKIQTFYQYKSSRKVMWKLSQFISRDFTLLQILCYAFLRFYTLWFSIFLF